MWISVRGTDSDVAEFGRSSRMPGVTLKVVDDHEEDDQLEDHVDEGRHVYRMYEV